MNNSKFKDVLSYRQVMNIGKGRSHSVARLRQRWAAEWAWAPRHRRGPSTAIGDIRDRGRDSKLRYARDLKMPC